MILSILSLETRHPHLAAAEPPADESGEFEIVLGRSQVASLLFVATVVIAVFSAVSYLAGKSTPPPKVDTAAPAIPVPPAVIAPTVASIEPPLFAEPVAGAIYLQMSAVEDGIALIFCEGLRKRGFRAFAAPGPSPKIFRVLIGPLPDAESYQRVKGALDQIGLSSFARKYQQ